MRHITTVPNFTVNLKELQKETQVFFDDDSLWNKHNQLCFLNTPGHEPDLNQGVGNVLAEGYPASGLKDSDFTVFNPNYENTIFHEIYKAFPLPVTRMRLMKIPPKRCYSMHLDGPDELRYHIAVFTNPHAYFVYESTSSLHHVPADGQAYVFSVEEMHSAVNFNPAEPRIHVVLNGLR